MRWLIISKLVYVRLICGINTIAKAYSNSNIRRLNSECFGIDIDIELDLIIFDSVGCSIKEP